MGVSTDAYLFFGYCAQEEGEEMLFEGEQVEEPDDVDYEAEDYEEPVAIDVDELIAAKYGVVEPTTPYAEDKEAHAAYWAAKTAVLKATGVRVDTHGMATCSMRFIAVESTFTRASRGSPAKVNTPDITMAELDRLAAFCEKVGYVSDVPPAWWLCSYWSE